MSRFFRATRPFVKSLVNISTPLCVSFGIASTIPTKEDSPAYVRDAFNNFNAEYDRKTNRPALEQKHVHIIHDEPEIEYNSTQQTDNNVQLQQETEVEAEEEESIESTQQEVIESSSSWNSNSYLARFIDHTVLKPKSSQDDIKKMCQEAIDHDFFSVCCNPCWVSLCKELLQDTSVKICCVVGFPLGSNTTQIKVLEAQQAVKDGADEIDMVMNIGQAKSGQWDKVQNDIAMVVDAVNDDIAVKVILETCLLDDNEVIEACKCATQAGAKFVKTSTGFGGDGATLHHVSLMRKTVDEEADKLGMQIGSVLVKASGGIRDSKTAKEMLNAGADRIGASSGIKIIGAQDDSQVIIQSAKTQKATQY